MNGLAEFLLARIAEDEAAMRALLGYQHWVDGQPPPNATTPMARVLDWTMTPARVLAECEAKRRIVKDAQRNPHAPRDAYAIGREDLSRAVLRLLALPYADHSDYDPAWGLA